MSFNPIAYSPKVLQLEESATLSLAEKVRAYVREGRDVVDLTVGEPDFNIPEEVRQAASNALSKGRSKYVSSSGILELRTRIAEKLQRENQIDAQSSEIIVTPGVKQALFYAFMAILREGDEVVIPDPYWASYHAMVSLAGGKLVGIPVKEEREFKLTPDELEARLSPRTRVLVLVNPNNPTGTLLEEHDLQAIAEVVARNNLFVIVDEIYERIIYDSAKFVSFASLLGMKERTVTVNGFSKSLAITGWRLGYACGPPTLIVQMVKLQQHIATCANSLAQYSIADAFPSITSSVTEMVKKYEARRNFLVAGIQRMSKYSCVVPKGTFYLWLNVKQFGQSSYKIAEEMLDRAQVAVVPGLAFGENGEGYVRISFAAPKEILQKALQRLEQF